MAAPLGNSFSPGRPSEYDSEFHDEQAYRLCLLGKTVDELAECFGVGKTTIKRWFKEHPSFWAAVSRGREYADAMVAEGLFKRATGFSIDSEQLMVVKVSREEEEVQRHATKTYYPPDPGAAMNWLKNRQPDQWRDNLKLELPPEIVVKMNLDGDAPKPTTEE